MKEENAASQSDRERELEMDQVSDYEREVLRRLEELGCEVLSCLHQARSFAVPPIRLSSRFEVIQQLADAYEAAEKIQDVINTVWMDGGGIEREDDGECCRFIPYTQEGKKLLCFGDKEETFDPPSIERLFEEEA